MRNLFLSLIIVLALTGCSQQAHSVPAEGTALKNFLASSKKPAIIKFYASWCASCKQYAPAFQEAKLAKSTEVDFFEIDVDAASTKALIRELRISRIPETIFVSADRATITRKLGPISAAELGKLADQLKAN